KDERLAKAMELALADNDARLRTEGRRVLAKLDPVKAVGVLEEALKNGSAIEQQGALDILGGLPGKEADAILGGALERLLAGQTPAEIQLDLLLAAERRTSPSVKAKLAKYEEARPKNDLFAKYREALSGGDTESGRAIFLYKSEVSCLRCHKVK